MAVSKRYKAYVNELGEVSSTLMAIISAILIPTR